MLLWLLEFNDYIIVVGEKGWKAVDTYRPSQVTFCWKDPGISWRLLRAWLYLMAEENSGLLQSMKTAQIVNGYFKHLLTNINVLQILDETVVCMLYRLYAEGNFRRCYSGGLKLWAGPRLLTIGTFAVGPVDLFTWLLSPHLHHTWYVIVICPHVMVKTFQTRDNDMWLLDAWWWTETKSILWGLETKEWELRDGEDETKWQLSENHWSNVGRLGVGLGRGRRLAILLDGLWGVPYIGLQVGFTQMSPFYWTLATP